MADRDDNKSDDTQDDEKKKLSGLKLPPPRGKQFSGRGVEKKG